MTSSKIEKDKKLKNDLIKFRLCYTIRDLAYPTEDVEFNQTIIHDVKIKVTKPDPNYLERSKTQHITFCTAELFIKPNAQNKKIIDNIVDNIYKEEFDKSNGYSSIKKEAEEIIIPNLSFFDKKFKDFINQIKSELSEAIRETTNIIRWLLNIEGHHNPFSFKSYMFSVNNLDWYPVPSTFSFTAKILDDNIILDNNDKNIIQYLLSERINEPIYHSLFREAWDLKQYNPRSSLIIAISAVEVAIKILIENKVPEASWLLKNMQSPSIYNILINYLPNLLIKNAEDNKYILPNQKILDRLRKSINQRNELVHLGHEKLKGEALEGQLVEIREILFMIDYNRGFEWAKKYIRDESINKDLIKQ